MVIFIDCDEKKDGRLSTAAPDLGGLYITALTVAMLDLEPTGIGRLGQFQQHPFVG
jgi:hypothetical protein